MPRNTRRLAVRENTNLKAGTHWTERSRAETIRPKDGAIQPETLGTQNIALPTVVQAH